MPGSPLFTLNPSSGVPIYRQVIDQTRRLVASGRLVPGDKLPSVRAVATELGVNPMTVSKAYSMLDQAGIVVRRHGIGMVVAMASAQRALALEPEAHALVGNAKELGMSRADLVAQIERIWRKHDGIAPETQRRPLELRSGACSRRRRAEARTRHRDWPSRPQRQRQDDADARGARTDDARRGIGKRLRRRAWDSPARIRKRIGFVPQQFESFGWMDVDACVAFVARHYRNSWDHQLVSRLTREWRLRNRKIATLSPGDQQKVAILLAIGHRPDLLVLDEPVASLDPAARRDFLRMLMEINVDQGQTILLSSHITSDIERVCSHIAILHGGRILCHAALDEIKERVRAVTLPRAPYPPEQRVLGRYRDRFWVWDPQSCGLPPDATAEETPLEDLFVGVTS